MTKYKPGQIIESYVEFIEAVRRDPFFYFHNDLTQSQVAMAWQLSTVLRYADKKDGTLRYAVAQEAK